MALIIVQARTSSTRLPGKVLKPLVGKPMIMRQLERLSGCKSLDSLVVATSNEHSDDELAKVLHNNDIHVQRGSLQNVFSRFAQILENEDCETVVRLTADCPLIDAHVVDLAVQIFESGSFDYVSNTLRRTYPRGLDVEVFNCAKFLEIYRKENLSEYEKEHVTPYFYNNPERFSLNNFVNNEDLSKHRWTVDTLDDFEFVTNVYEQLFVENEKFTTQDILEFLSREPGLVHLETE